VPGDLGLSAGEYKDGYWFLSESVLSSPIRVIGLPEHFNGQITITGNGYETGTVEVRLNRSRVAMRMLPSW